MDRRKFALSLISTAGLAACGGGSGGGAGFPVLPPSPAPAPAPAPSPDPTDWSTTLAATLVFPQNIAVTEPSTKSPFSLGQANVWDLRNNFTLSDGGADQFDGAMSLEVRVSGGWEEFPSDQVYSELTPLGPEFDTADGIRRVSFSSDWPYHTYAGTACAVMHHGPEVRLSQELPALTGAAGPLTLTWDGERPDLDGDFDEESYVRVVLRDASGAVRQTLYEVVVVGNVGNATGNWGSMAVSETLRQDSSVGALTLSFEYWSGSSRWNSAVVANVSLSDGTTEFIRNGDFANNGAGWTVSGPRVSQNLRSGVRTVGDLQITRNFYVTPTSLWGRFTDEFHNPTNAPITTQVRYWTNLGSDDEGVIYRPTGAESTALVTWDSRANGADRDVGWVHGSATTVEFASVSSMGSNDGSDDIFVTHDITVPAGATVSLVNFIILSPDATQRTAADITARATIVDAEAVRLATTFLTDTDLQRGLTPQQLDTVQNF